MSIPLDEQHDLKQGPSWLVRMALEHPEAASWGVRSWYVVLCVLPFAAAAFLPWWLLPELGGAEDVQTPALVGLLLWAFGLFVGTIGGALGFSAYRRAGLAHAQEWHALAVKLAVIVVLVGCIGNFIVTVNAIIGFAEGGHG